MSAVQKAETTYLRGFADAYLSETSFSPAGERSMIAESATWIDVHQVMISGVVEESEKTDAHCAVWVVCGKNCDGDRFYVTLEVEPNLYRVCVVGVKRL